MEPRVRKIRSFELSSGKVPFEDWFRQLRDKSVKARVATRVDRLRLGNFGDCKSLGNGVFKLRIHFGPGLRVYFGLVGNELILLLGGGDKAT